MAIFSNSWAGREDTAVAERPRLETALPKLKPRVDTAVMRDDHIAEYRKTAAEVGLSDQDILVEEFRAFLAKKDIPVFNHQEVVAYMDEIAAKDNPTKLGWHWCPVRPKDAQTPLTFGRPSVSGRGRQWSDGRTVEDTPASDFYESHRFHDWHEHGRGGWHHGGFVSMHSSDNRQSVHVEANVRVMQEAYESAHREAVMPPPSPRDWRTETSPAYTRTLPLHALKKIALIEREFTAGKAVFLVTDYTTAPHVIVNPDPFLMAVIPNSAVAHGKGRFIIDVWDEPGFGIDRMVR